jgi:hypothetical protein
MPDFSHLKRFDVAPTATAEYRMTLILMDGKIPSLTVSPATEANKPYFAGVLKRQRTRRGSNVVSHGALIEQRNEDRSAYAKHVIRGWSGIVDADNNPVEFSYENCLDFLRALPPSVFDDLRLFCQNDANFQDEDLFDVEAASKN